MGLIKSIIVDNIIDSMAIGLLVIDPKGRITLTNQAATNILGLQRGQLEGKSWGETFFNVDDNFDFNQVIVDVVWQRKVNLHREVAYRGPGGDVRYLQITSSYLRDAEEIAGIVVLIADETEIHAGRQREKAALEEKNRIQNERVEALKRLALGVAHEIRNPITVIGGFARRLEKDTVDGCINSKYLEQIIAGARRLEDIIRAVKDYTDLRPIKRSKVTLESILEAALRRVESPLRPSPKINISWPPEQITVDVDFELMINAIGEVLENAAEAAKGGQVQILVSSDLRGVTLEIADSGQGIQPSDRPFIFDPFFSTKAHGLGMGLPRVQRILAEHQGGIQIDSSPGQGTRVYIFIPHFREPV